MKNFLIENLSKARLRRYEFSERNYRFDTELAEAFYPSLRMVEILLRNHLDKYIALFLKKENWLITSIEFLEITEMTMLQDSYNKIKKNNSRYSPWIGEAEGE
jgi:hypothetical protein